MTFQEKLTTLVKTEIERTSNHGAVAADLATVLAEIGVHFVFEGASDGDLERMCSLLAENLMDVSAQILEHYETHYEQMMGQPYGGGKWKALRWN